MCYLVAAYMHFSMFRVKLSCSENEPSTSSSSVFFFPIHQMAHVEGFHEANFKLKMGVALQTVKKILDINRHPQVPRPYLRRCLKTSLDARAPYHQRETHPFPLQDDTRDSYPITNPPLK